MVVLPSAMFACAEPGRCTSRMSVATRVAGAGRTGLDGGAPASERLRRKLPHLSVGNVSRDHEQRADRPQPLPNELDDVVAGDGPIALARGAPAIGVTAVDLLPEEPLRHRA